MSQTDEADAFPVSERNRVRRRPQRGFYDRATVHAILDAAMLCHVAYVIDGQPYCTPTGFWREGDTLLWHGSSASRMLRAQREGIPVCVTVTHMDAIVLARCGFNHSINYRSVMAYGRASLVEDGAAKRRAMDAFVDRFFPGRSRVLREPTAQEIKATSFLCMPIDEASAKIRDVPPHDDEADYAVPAWTALLPIRTVFGKPQECERQHPHADRTAGGIDPYRAGRTLDEVFAETAGLYGAADTPD
jgi:nitroimidazol reductase NimA-like FMN-containing flavoprotein (pyridoxamine 5'-phosphate oxidase superfamily)